MSKKTNPKQLLVEGKNDRHVIWALCGIYQLPQTFSVEIAEERGTEGIEALLGGLPSRIEEQNLETLGIVVDADRDVWARWQAIRDRLNGCGYENIPQIPPPEGWVFPSTNPFLPKVGVWLMPDNQLPGMLEDFVAQLIPPEDALFPKAETVLNEIESAGLNRYSLVQHPKALIHTWLAWQETPGMAMGQAITARVLLSNSPVARVFVGWLNYLFDINLEL
ncbi:MAG: hypothetical protein F6K35_40695 [Okeania sp. SIO2H7]|nr:hypothetical protein [Okeania sp. SIO2H7]